jgi:hypothetical protein
MCSGLLGHFLPNVSKAWRFCIQTAQILTSLDYVQLPKHFRKSLPMISDAACSFLSARQALMVRPEKAPYR